jgi:hypothetical protein
MRGKTLPLLDPTVLLAKWSPVLPLTASGRKIPDASWLALTLFSESDQPNEWPAVASVIINRSRNKTYPGKYHGDIYSVVRQKEQFSAFNKFDSIEDEVSLFNAVAQDIGFTNTNLSLVSQTVGCAVAMLLLPPDCVPLPPTTLSYWSPVSMKPAGSLPRDWDWPTLYCFSYPGVSWKRFVFAEVVSGGLVGGNQAQFTYTV